MEMLKLMTFSPTIGKAYVLQGVKLVKCGKGSVGSSSQDIMEWVRQLLFAKFHCSTFPRHGAVRFKGRQYTHLLSLHDCSNGHGFNSPRTLHIFPLVDSKGKLHHSRTLNAEKLIPGFQMRSIPFPCTQGKS